MTTDPKPLDAEKLWEEWYMPDTAAGVSWDVLKMFYALARDKEIEIRALRSQTSMEASAAPGPYGYAVRLATSLARKHWPEITGWKPLGDLMGVLSQLDNMTAGMVRILDTPEIREGAKGPEDVNPKIRSLEKTARGFALINFKDRYGANCSLQKSSIATEDCIWFGVDDEPKKHLGEWLSQRMHLTQAMVAEMLPYLKTFVESGELQSAPPDASPGETADSAIDWWNPGHRLTEGELEAVEKTYHAARRGRRGPDCSTRHALECVIREWLTSQSPLPACPKGGEAAKEDKIFQQGFDAYHEDQGVDEKPYTQRTEEWDIWDYGWHSAFECEAMEE